MWSCEPSGGRAGEAVMNFDFSEKEEPFRKDVRHWLETHLPDALRGRAFASSRADRDEVRRLRAWQRAMHEAGYVGMDWPREFGGRGASIVEMVILYQEMARAESPQFVNRGGISMLGPTLMKHGTPAQQKRFLPRILTAEEVWCQGFSEPNAGSDHAGLRARPPDLHPARLAPQRAPPAGPAGPAAEDERRSHRAPEGRRPLDRRAGASAQRLPEPHEHPARRRPRPGGLDLQAVLEPGGPGPRAGRHGGDRPLLADHPGLALGAGRGAVGVLRAARPGERHPRRDLRDPPQRPRRARARPTEGLGYE